MKAMFFVCFYHIVITLSLAHRVVRRYRCLSIAPISDVHLYYIIISCSGTKKVIRKRLNRLCCSVFDELKRISRYINGVA